MKTNTLYGSRYSADLKRRNRAAAQRRKKTMTCNSIIVSSRVFYVIAVLCISLSIATVGAMVFMRNYYNSVISDMDAEIQKLQLENTELHAQIDEFGGIYSETVCLLDETVDIARTLDETNHQLVSDMKAIDDRLKDYERREELYDKYDYAIIREDNTRTDITYEDLDTLESLVKEKGLSEDTNDLILSLAMTESRGFEDAENSSSTATGLGQILQGTAKFIYEKLMGNPRGSYSHDLALDGETNLTMMVYYLDYLGEKYSDNITLVLNEYRGDKDQSYNNKINKYLAKAGAPNVTSIVLRP